MLHIHFSDKAREKICLVLRIKVFYDLRNEYS